MNLLLQADVLDVLGLIAVWFVAGLFVALLFGALAGPRRRRVDIDDDKARRVARIIECGKGRHV